MLYDQNSKFTCDSSNCGEDYANSSVIGVNVKWFADKKQSSTPKDCGMVTTNHVCLPANVYNYTATCTSGLCVKSKNQPFAGCVPQSIDLDRTIPIGGGNSNRRTVRETLEYYHAACNSNQELVTNGKKIYFYKTTKCNKDITPEERTQITQEENNLMKTYEVIEIDNPCES
jgi:hypothetical protein